MTAPLVDRLQAAVDHPSHFSDSEHAELHAEAIEALGVRIAPQPLTHRTLSSSFPDGLAVVTLLDCNTEPNR